MKKHPRPASRSALLTLTTTCALLAAACSTAPPHPPLPAASMQIGGQDYIINQLTASTWTASAKGNKQPLPATPAGQAALREAIEKTSGCKVSDSDYSHQGFQFDAQVECGNRLEN